MDMYVNKWMTTSFCNEEIDVICDAISELFKDYFEQPNATFSMICNSAHEDDIETVYCNSNHCDDEFLALAMIAISSTTDWIVEQSRRDQFFATSYVFMEQVYIKIAFLRFRGLEIILRIACDSNIDASMVNDGFHGMLKVICRIIAKTDAQGKKLEEEIDKLKTSETPSTKDAVEQAVNSFLNKDCQTIRKWKELYE